MQIKLICIGKIKETFYRNAISNLLIEIKKHYDISIIELDEEKASKIMHTKDQERIIILESNKILEKISPLDFVIALDVIAPSYSTKNLFKEINRKLAYQKKNVVFIIGGSYGFSDSIRKRSNMRVSFSKMTFPHQLMRVLLLEQLTYWKENTYK